MKRNLPGLALLLALLSFTFTGFAQSFTATYDFSSFTTGSGMTDPTSILPPPITGANFGNFTAVGTPANSNAGNRFSFTNWPLGATNGSNTFAGSINTSQYYEVTITPQTNFSVTLSSIIFTLQRSSTGIRQYAVRSSQDGFTTNLSASISPANGNLQVVPSNVFQVVDATSAAENGSTITLTGFTNLSSATTFRFYGFNAEAAGGTFSIDNVAFTGSTAATAGTPSLTLSKTSMDFPATYNGATSITQTYTILGENLTGPVDITTTDPFLISSDDVDYETSITLLPEDVLTAKTIYVRFNPNSYGSFSVPITHESNGATTKEIIANGDGIDPSVQTFEFDACSPAGTPGMGFTSYSVTGSQKWACTTFGRSGTNGVDMNGFSGGALLNEDWLISPNLDFSTFFGFPVLSFYSRTEFTGPTLELLVSTDYIGVGDPNNATWTPLNGNFPAGGSNTWTSSDNISLGAFKSSPTVYIAFKYTSSPGAGAARWTIDDIAITDETVLFSVSPLSLNFGETGVGTQSASQPANLQAIGYGDITVNAPGGFEVSDDEITFSSSITIPEAAAEAGTTFYVRFSPTTKELSITGDLNFTGTGLNETRITLLGSSYPKSQTLDIACYNLSFFGSNATNNPTQAKIDLQVANITTVIEHLDMDVIGIEEMSNSTALTSLMDNLPAYDTVISQRWSHSFDAPDPNFPPQKIGFIYNRSTMQLVEKRVLFEAMYDSARTGLSSRLNDYPTAEGASSFWSSGRLPFMALFNMNIGGIVKPIRVIVVHGKAGGSDEEDYNRRLYDARVLKDTIDAFYPNENVVILGDYNDRLVTSIYPGNTVSPYADFVNDNIGYIPLTYDLDLAGETSFPGDEGMIDQIITSNEFNISFIPGSAQIEDARTYISGYNATTASDHLPVFSRFSQLSALPVKLTHFGAVPKGTGVLVTWTTASEQDNNYFVVERSSDGRNFTALSKVNGSGNISTQSKYQYIDASPLPGTSYYRLKQVDVDGKATYSFVAVVKFQVTNKLMLYPNPVTDHIQLDFGTDSRIFTAELINTDGRVLFKFKGDIGQLNQQLNQNIGAVKPGVYILQLTNSSSRYNTKFIKQ